MIAERIQADAQYKPKEPAAVVTAASYAAVEIGRKYLRQNVAGYCGVAK